MKFAESKYWRVAFSFTGTAQSDRAGYGVWGGGAVHNSSHIVIEIASSAPAFVHFTIIESSKVKSFLGGVVYNLVVLSLE
jgi:hypothetical protein